jgi:hypothetical protein
MECEDIRQRLKAFVDDDLEDPERAVVRDHLVGCRECARAARQLGRLPAALQAWKVQELPAGLSERLKAGLESRSSRRRRVLTPAFTWKAALRLAEVAGIVLITLFVSGRFRKIPVVPPDDDLATINLYMTEHQEAVLQAASAESLDRQPARVSLSREDILYYEFVDGERQLSRPGLILRGPTPPSRPSVPAVAPATGLSGTKSLTLPEARKAVSFEPVAPSRIHPGYILDGITKVPGRESLHLLYTNGIETLSVFEQPLGGEQGLAAEDFRKYAVYKSAASAEVASGQAGMTILAWKNTHVSFVLIGRAEMSRLMEFAQVFSDMSKAMNESGE